MPKIPKEAKRVIAAVNPLKKGLGEKLKALGDETKTEQPLPHLMIKAYAGSGKTSTLVEGLRLLIEGETTFKPSPQQEMIWEELLKSQDYAKTFCMTSFGNEIVKTLEERIPKHPSCVAKTLHSIGLKAINESYGKRFEPDQFRSGKILASFKKISYEALLHQYKELADNVSELVSYCKFNAWIDASKLSLQWLVEQYNLDIEVDLEMELQVNAVLRESRIKVDSIDYDDMIWLPTVNNLLLPVYDILFCDECQDFNVCQQKLALKIGRRIVCCGDPHQAVYAFAGADANSYQNLYNALQSTELGCVDLPLSVSFRCSQQVIMEAQKWVKGIEPYCCNPMGKITETIESELIHVCKPGDLAICRNNAALVSQCLKFLGAGKKAYIRGRKNIAKGLVRLVRKIAKGCRCGDGIHDFIKGVQRWEEFEIQKAKEQTPPDERQIEYIKDRAKCLYVLSNGCYSVSRLQKQIIDIFEDKTSEGIQLATIHQAKGIEARRVFFIMTKGNECPAHWAKGETQKIQECNLRYIGITRSIEELIYVT